MTGSPSFASACYSTYSLHPVHITPILCIYIFSSYYTPQRAISQTYTFNITHQLMHDDINTDDHDDPNEPGTENVVQSGTADGYFRAGKGGGGEGKEGYEGMTQRLLTLR